MTINALAFENPDGDVIRRRLELNWFGASEGDVVALYDEEPGDQVEPILKVNPAEHQPDRHHVTDIILPNKTSSELG